MSTSFFYLFDNSFSLFLLVGTVMPFFFFLVQINFLLCYSSDQSLMVKGLYIHLDEELCSLGYKLVSFASVRVTGSGFIFARSLFGLSSVIKIGCGLLSLVTFNQLFISLGVNLSLPFSVGYWLGVCAAGIVLCPFVAFSGLVLLLCLENSLKHQLFGDRTGTHRLWSREVSRGSNYFSLTSFFIDDLPFGSYPKHN
jgi:hypothetical protein